LEIIDWKELTFKSRVDFYEGSRKKVNPPKTKDGSPGECAAPWKACLALPLDPPKRGSGLVGNKLNILSLHK